MANRRKFIAGLGALAAGSAAAIGTGAFTSVEANRAVSVTTAGDANAYLGLVGDGEYVEDNSEDGELTINLGDPDNLGGGPTGSGDAATEGDGFNESAVTTVEDIVTVTNQGPNQIRVDFNNKNNEYKKEKTVSLTDAEVTFTLPGGDARLLSSGKSCNIDATVDTTDDAGDDNGSSDDLTIFAYSE